MKKNKSIAFIIFFLHAYAFVAFGAEAPAPATGSSLIARTESTLENFSKHLTVEKSDFKVKFGIESRYRLELKDDFNFNDATYEDDAINLFRNRISADIKAGDHFRGFIEMQDAASFASSNLNKSTSNVNRTDLRQLFAEIKSPWDDVPLSIKVGRQELAFGDQRFMGPSTWGNTSKVFDAVRLTATPRKWLKADAWYGRFVRIRRVQADTATNEDNFYGLYTALGPFSEQVLDTFLLVRNNVKDVTGERPGETGVLKEYTAGNRFKGKYKNLDYGIEWAFQFGSRAHNKIRAFIWHNEVGYTLAGIPWKPRPNFEFNHGSGDDNTTDGVFKNFDILFASNHPKYGFMDLASLRNMNNVKIGLEANPHPKIKLSVDHHWFVLDSNKSAWVNASGATVRSTIANVDPYLGQELDLLAKWQVIKQIEILLGYSHFFTGKFIEATGRDNDANFFYVQTSLTV